MKPLVVHEICYELWNGANINGQMIKQIIQAIFSIKTKGAFYDPTKMACKPYDVVYNPFVLPSSKADQTKDDELKTESKQCNRNIIRLIESKLHKIIKEWKRYIC